MSKNQKKLPHIEYFLKDKLQKLRLQKTELESQLTMKPCIELSQALDRVNYHIECTENRLAGRFNDPLQNYEHSKVEQTRIYTHTP